MAKFNPDRMIQDEARARRAAQKALEDEMLEEAAELLRSSAVDTSQDVIDPHALRETEDQRRAAIVPHLRQRWAAEEAAQKSRKG